MPRPTPESPFMPENLVVRIPLASIDARDRLRPVKMDRAEAIAESMAVVGQLQSILVRPCVADGFDYRLVIGGHRLAGAEILGWTEIEAKIADLGDLKARLAEIDENLARDLSYLDESIFVLERKRIWEALHPDTAHGGDRKSSKFKGRDHVAKLATRFTAEASEALNRSERTIRRHCMVATGLAPNVVELVRQTYLVNHQGDLEKLARMAPEKQVEGLKRLASGECKTLAGAFGRTERNLEDKLVEAFEKLWMRAGRKVRRRMLTFAGVSKGEIDRIVGEKADLQVAAG